jgi:hypothetical protein
VRAGWRVRRLTDGSAVLGRRLGRWFVPEDRLVATVVRCGGAVLAAPRVLDLAHQSSLWLAGGTCVWCWAAWRAEEPQAPASDVGEDVENEEAAGPAEDEPEEGEEDEGTEFLAALHQLMPAPEDRLHLAQIAAAHLGDERATGRVRELCAAAGVPIDDVRVRGRGSSTGVYARKLPPLPDPSRRPLLTVVGAGQSGQQQHQQQPGEGTEKGFTSRPHPDGNPGRSEVVWHDQDDRQTA